MIRPQPNTPSRRRRWLCIAYAFPPINRSGTHRTVGFVRHLHTFGWDAAVVTVEAGDEPLDQSLMERIPRSTSVIRTPWTDLIAATKRLCLRGGLHRPIESPATAPESASVESSCTPARGHVNLHRKPCGDDLPQSETADSLTVRTDGYTRIRPMRGGLTEWVSRLLMTPDSRVGWIAPAVTHGMQTIRRWRPDVIYSTSPYMSAHLVGLILSKRTGLPWVADFRDPWCDNPFREMGFSSLEWLDGWLERRVLRQAAHVICTTPTMSARLQERHPFIADKSSTILNGYDRELFDSVVPLRDASPDLFVLMHCGQFYGPRSPRVWFTALRLALQRSPALAGKLQLALVGPESYDGRSLENMASEAGVGHCVRVLGPKSHSMSLSYMAGSDALALAACDGPAGDLQVPNKLFEYLAVRKPIIAAVPGTNPSVSILRDARAEAVVCRPTDANAIARAIVEIAMRRHVRDDNSWSGVVQFSRFHRAVELARVFDHLSPGRPSVSARLLASAVAPVERIAPGNFGQRHRDWAHA